MLEPVTYSVSELAQRWNVTPRQILDMALQLRVPLYFNFDGLVFEITDDWHRHAGDSREAEELEALQADIERNNAWLARRARGETDEYDYLSDEDARELREAITNNQQEVETLKDKLEARERERRHAHYLGAIRPPAETLREIQRDGESDTPHWGYHPESAIKVVHIPARKYGGAGGLVGEGHLLALEPYLTPWRKLTADSLFAMTAEVKAIEAHQQSKNSPAATADEPDAPSLQWWERDLFELAQNIGDKLHSQHERPSNSRIADEIATRLRNIERSKASERKTPAADTVRKRLAGWEWTKQ